MNLNFTGDKYRCLQSMSEEKLLEEFRNGTLLNTLDISTELELYTRVKQLDENNDEIKNIIKNINENRVEIISNFNNQQIIFNPNEGFIKELTIYIKYKYSDGKKLNLEKEDIIISENIKFIEIKDTELENGEQLISVYFKIEFLKGTPQGNYYEYMAFPKNFNSKTYTFSIICDGGYTFKQYPKNLQEFGILFEKDNKKALELFNNDEFKYWLRYKDKSINKIDNKLEADLYERIYHNNGKRGIDELKEFFKIIEIIPLDKTPSIPPKETSPIQPIDVNRRKPKIKEYNIKETMGISGKIKLDKLIDINNYRFKITNVNDIYICHIEEDGSVIIKQDIPPIERIKIKIIEAIRQKSTSILYSMKLIKDNKKDNGKLSLLREDILKDNQKIYIRAIPNDKNEYIKIYTIEILRK